MTSFRGLREESDRGDLLPRPAIMSGLPYHGKPPLRSLRVVRGSVWALPPVREKEPFPTIEDVVPILFGL